jgi:hypothetical protein
MFNPWAMMMAGGLGGGGGSGRFGGSDFMREMMETQSHCDSMSYKPRLVYGVQEEDSDKILSSILTDGFAPHLQTFASNVIRLHGCNVIYGCEMTVGEALSGEKLAKMKTVDRFAKKFDFGKPKILVAVKGNYKLCYTEYEPEEKMPKARKSKKDNDKEHDEEKLDRDDEGGESDRDKKADQVDEKQEGGAKKNTDAEEGGGVTVKGKGKQRKEVAPGGTGKKARR